MSNKDIIGSLGIGFLVGAAAGLAVGILYAPHSGKITRGLLEEKSHEATHRAAKIIEEAKDKAEGIVKDVKSNIKG